MEKKAVIEFKDVKKVYPNGTVGLKNINLSLYEGEFVVVVGLSGAGKSTLLRTVNRMHDITSGDLLIEGQSIVNLKGKALRNLRRKIGMIFQGFNLVKRASVQRNVLSGRVGYYPTWKSVLGLFSKEDKQKAVEALKRVNMASKIYTRADELSGGQQQRVAIARTFMQDPTIILADEPIASLDPKTTKSVMDDLKQLNKDFNMTVLANLHSVDLALEYADRIIGLRAGELVYDKPIAEVSRSDFDSIYDESKNKLSKEA
ncbi:phosphate phosphonate ABC transporter ATPase [Ligilactobacillus hayakitensis DSM 18933 = JCM 14209]|uniref:Phosphate phosphonate ABC transporter ATPase n=1 Tax=Ligilactobacillus hayakitensis DSM 18933 = JCM 14209 TaxID=1423755 RepID=A0A0R1WPW3_9LACO|nr:phosphonate ABC transporter ATP-binding protein [Ligilactobacillus hayakitensis]KRM19810.1 phosphate phosphonate ABC transporter ATPase [Ligilactobacillus hayakitensis DSM 18933 = JCM 14209]